MCSFSPVSTTMGNHVFSISFPFLTISRSSATPTARRHGARQRTSTSHRRLRDAGRAVPVPGTVVTGTATGAVLVPDHAAEADRIREDVAEEDGHRPGTATGNAPARRTRSAIRNARGSARSADCRRSRKNTSVVSMGANVLVVEVPTP